MDWNIPPCIISIITFKYFMLQNNLHIRLKPILPLQISGLEISILIFFLD